MNPPSTNPVEFCSHSCLLCSRTLDEAFESKERISLDVKERLKGILEDFGYDILQTLVSEMDCDRKVGLNVNE